MKKAIISMLFIASLSCTKKAAIDPLGSNSCEKTAKEYEKVITEWSTDVTNKAKCEAVKKALNAIIKDCSIYTAAQRKVYEEQLKDFTCD